MLWLWLGFSALVGVLLLLHRKLSPAARRGAAYWTAAWFLIGLAFVGLIYPMYEHAWLGATLAEPSDSPGADASIMFVSAYLLEYALAFDSLIVISLLCRMHRVPNSQQPRVVFWSLVGAIVVRVIILTAGASLARAAAWTYYVFGAFVVYSALTVLKSGDDEDEWCADSDSAVVQRRKLSLTRMLWRIGRLTDRDNSGTFWLTESGHTLLTMAAACVLSIVLSDGLFALDSAVAVLSVTRTTFIVVTSNVLAAIALRGWFPMLGTVEKFQAPRIALSALLGIVGIKLLMHHHLVVPPAVFLALIAVLIGAAVAESLVATRRARSG